MVRAIFEVKLIQFFIFPFSYWQVCVSTIGGSCCVFSLTPVFFEYTAELTYPLSEGLSGGWLTIFYNLIGTVVFACSEENKYIGVIWIDWVLFASCLGKIFRLSQPYLIGHPYFNTSYLTDSYISFTLKLKSGLNFCYNRSIRSSTYGKKNIFEIPPCGSHFLLIHFTY